MSNRLLSLYNLFGFKSTTKKSTIENLVIFKRLVQDHNTKTKDYERLSDEYLAIILLHSLPESYIVLKNFFFNKEGFTIKLITDSLKFRSLRKQIGKNKSDGLF